MLRPGLSRSAVLLCALAVVACGGTPASTVDTPPTNETVIYRIGAPDGGAGAASDEPGTIGNFRVKPGPGEDGVIRVIAGQSLVVNGNDYRQSNPTATLYLIANWGDGTGNQRVGCGPCRVTHVYDTPGRFRLEMTMDDGIVPPPARAMSPVTEVVTVIVEGVQEPRAPIPPGNPPQAGNLSGFVSCPSGAFSLSLKITDPDGDPLSWKVTFTGGTLTTPAANGPVPSGTIVTSTGNLGPGVANVFRLDVVDATGRESVPATLFGPIVLPSCGGATLQIIG